MNGKYVYKLGGNDYKLFVLELYVSFLTGNHDLAKRNFSMDLYVHLATSSTFIYG